jgi:hypothetical protein
MTYSAVDWLMKGNTGRVAEQLEQNALAHAKILVRQASGRFTFGAWLVHFMTLRHQALLT